MNPTRMLLGATLAATLVAALLIAQVPRTNIYSRPAPPSDEALRRMNLTLAWRSAVPMDGRRDGLLLVSMDRRDLIVLTRSGEVVRIDAESGIEKWRARVGKAYTILPYYAANSRSVYVAANAILYALDRETGGKKWEYRLPSALSTAPVADEEQLYLPGADGRLYTWGLPFAGVGEDLRPGNENGAPYAASREPARTVRPAALWEEETNIQLAFKPLEAYSKPVDAFGKPLEPFGMVFLVSPAGNAVAYYKKLREGALSTEIYRFTLDGKVRQQLGQYDDTAYIGAEDATLYAVNLISGKLRWRHTAGTAISRRPVALEKDVYVTSSREGLARIDRESGSPMWNIPRGREIALANIDADRFLAVNHKFVYASDNSGRLLILDRKRGVKLSMLDTSTYRFPVVNELTDRLYLASNDGLIVCLHDRDQVRPIRHRFALEQAGLPILKELDKPVQEPGSKPATLRETLKQISDKYLGGGKKFKLVVSAAFKQAGRPDVQEAQVTIPRIERGVLRELLQKILSQINATYQVVDDTILIIPGKPR